LKARWFGRARSLTLKKRLMEVLYDGLYLFGWPARLGRPLGFQGPLQIREYSVSIPRGRPDRSPALRVGFMSDLHAGPATHETLIQEACAAIAHAKPDLLLLGGDYVSFHARHAAHLVQPLASIEAPLGKFAILGNHDLIGDEQYIVSKLSEAGIRTLKNESVQLPAPHDDLWLVGFDNFEEGSPDAQAAFEGARGTRLVLMHSPDGLTPIGSSDFAVALCGHVHGGQFWFRGRSLLGFHGPLSVKYLRGGLFPLDHGRTLVVSRGIGCGSLPMRRGADPEVVLCTFTSTNESQR
jgi:uncharacterized protein